MPSDKFRLFISTAAKSKKEIEEEVKRLIRSKIESVVENAIRDAAESVPHSGGEKIPPRRDDISYASGKRLSERPLAADELAYAPETPSDSPITETIRRMRELGQTFYNGYMLKQCAELTIVKQGEFMRDVTDDFGRTAFCAVERPVYGALSIEQLRTYFTWRTDVRRGVYNRIDKPYVILYCYELMNKIGVMSSADAFNRLLDVWDNCRAFCPYLDTIMPIWARDFYAFNNIEGVFSELEGTFPKQSAHIDPVTEELFAGNYKNKLDYLTECSSYNLKGSIFFKEERSPELMNGALEEVLKALDEYFRARDISLFELICGRSKKDFNWSPFYGAYVNLDRMDGFRTCRISVTERYCIKRGQPCFEKFERAPYRSFIGYVLKSTEAVMRRRTGFRYGISANLEPVLEDFLNRDRLHRAAGEEEFTRVIPEAVNRWCDKNGIFPKPKEKKGSRKSSFEEEFYSPEYGPTTPPRIVEIDAARLERIRRESEETAKKLIIEEQPDDTPAAEQIEELTARIEEDAFEERAEQAALEARSQYNLSALAEGWRQLAEALDPQSLEILRAVVSGTAEELCRDLAVMPEAEFERINGAALEFTGDIIIEDGEIIPDYSGEVAELLRIIGG